MTPIILARGRRTQVSITSSQLEPRLRSRPLQPAAMARQETRRGTVFEADLVAQLPVPPRYAGKPTHDREDTLHLIQDTCERAPRLPHLFPEATDPPALPLSS